MRKLFISDLHLSPAQPAIIELLLAFLDHHVRPDDTLYILGDLFEIWLGDDAIADDYQPVITALKQLTQRGNAVYFMHGNRDFLCGEDFAKQSGCTLLDDPTLIDHHGEKILLMHGDTLCTDDHAYQTFRSKVRNPPFIAAFLAKSIDERLAIVNDYRQQSREETSMKKETIMDVNAQAVSETLQHYHVSTLIHGHTHRAATHDALLKDGSTAQRIVLSDWSEQQGHVLILDGSSIKTEHFSLDSLKQRA